MPKITINNGPSDRGAGWPGNSSSTSSESRTTSSEQSNSEPPNPAPTTENLSTQDPTDSSSASSTGGSGTVPPKLNASKQEWVDFVLSTDSFEGNPYEYTRDELAAWYHNN